MLYLNIIQVNLKTIAKCVLPATKENRYLIANSHLQIPDFHYTQELTHQSFERYDLAYLYH
jgi:hypothetical protein